MENPNRIEIIITVAMDIEIMMIIIIATAIEIMKIAVIGPIIMSIIPEEDMEEVGLKEGTTTKVGMGTKLSTPKFMKKKKRRKGIRISD